MDTEVKQILTLYDELSVSMKKGDLSLSDREATLVTMIDEALRNRNFVKKYGGTYVFLDGQVLEYVRNQEGRTDAFLIDQYLLFPEWCGYVRINEISPIEADEFFNLYRSRMWKLTADRMIPFLALGMSGIMATMAVTMADTLNFNSPISYGLVLSSTAMSILCGQYAIRGIITNAKVKRKYQEICAPNVVKGRSALEQALS